MSHERFSMTDDWELEDPEQDVRGRTVVDQSGTPIGTVTDMLVDAGTESIDAVILDDGREVSMSSLEIDRETVRLNDAGYSGMGTGTAATGVDDTYLDDQSRGGVTADATTAYAEGTTGYAQGTTGYVEGTADTRDSARVRLREEDLQARTRQEQAGEVVVDKGVVEEQRSIDVPVTHEEVVIQRRPVSGDVSDVDAGDLADGDTIRVPVMAEEVEVTKQPRVVEEIEISKRAVTETQRVSDTVRRETVDVRDEGDVSVVDGTTRDGGATR